jgi:hypothetical protein
VDCNCCRRSGDGGGRNCSGRLDAAAKPQGEPHASGRSPPGVVWPLVIQATEASSVPVDILEKDPPHRLVTRVTEREKNFGGTWTLTITAVPGGADVSIVEDGWVANPIFRFVSRYIIGHHATMDGMLKSIATSLKQEATLTGE